MRARSLLLCYPLFDASSTAEFGALGTHLWVNSLFEAYIAVENLIDA